MQGGALVYATRIPERWKPGAFDLMFHSHQLFHVAIIIAALVCLHFRYEAHVSTDSQPYSGSCDLISGVHFSKQTD